MFDPISEGRPEFTAVLRADGNWDIFIDGELAYSDFGDMSLVDFARDFRDRSLTPRHQPVNDHAHH